MAYSAGLPVQQIDLPPATGPVKINILVGNQILLGEVNNNGSQLRLHPAGQGDTIDSRALPGSDTNRIIRMRTSETFCYHRPYFTEHAAAGFSGADQGRAEIRSALLPSRLGDAVKSCGTNRAPRVSRLRTQTS